jgi:hypothetical protein
MLVEVDRANTEKYTQINTVVTMILTDGKGLPAATVSYDTGDTSQETVICTGQNPIVGTLCPGVLAGVAAVQNPCTYGSRQP